MRWNFLHPAQRSILIEAIQMNKWQFTFAVVLGTGYALATSTAFADEIKVALTGYEESPPVTTTATGSGTVTINADMTVSVNITTSGIMATAAHIHIAPRGQNGPVIVPFTKSGDNSWTAAPGAKLTQAQYEAYRAGGLYVNVHSEANRGGEIRGQILPPESK